jgi:hypothetical protein
VNSGFLSIAEPRVVGEVDQDMGLGFADHLSRETRKHVFVANRRGNTPVPQGHRTNVGACGEAAAVWGKLVQNRERVAEGEVLAEHQQIGLVVGRPDDTLRIGEEDGVVDLPRAVDAPGRHASEKDRGLEVLADVACVRRQATRQAADEGGFGPHDEVELAGLLQLAALLEVAPVALDGLGALREDTHVHLHDAQAKDRRCFQLCFDLGNSGGAVDHGEGERRDREPPDELRGTLAPRPPTKSLVDGEVHQRDHDRDEHRTSKVGDLNQGRLMLQAVGEICWEERRIDPLDQEQDRNGDDEIRP